MLSVLVLVCSEQDGSGALHLDWLQQNWTLKHRLGRIDILKKNAFWDATSTLIKLAPIVNRVKSEMQQLGRNECEPIGLFCNYTAGWGENTQKNKAIPCRGAKIWQSSEKCHRPGLVHLQRRHGVVQKAFVDLFQEQHWLQTEKWRAPPPQKKKNKNPYNYVGNCTANTLSDTGLA